MCVGVGGGGGGGVSFSCEAKHVWWRLAPLRCSIDFPTPGQTLLSLCDRMVATVIQ